MVALIQTQTAAAVPVVARQAAATTPLKQPKPLPFQKLKDQDQNHYHVKEWTLTPNQMTKVNRMDKKEVEYHQSHPIEMKICM